MSNITFQKIADYFIALSNATQNLITNLKLQKLVYYTQAWYLAIKKEPLFKEDFQAWVHGPVLPDLYFIYKDCKWNPIVRDDLTPEKLESIEAEFDQELKEHLKLIVDEYFGMTAYDLERLTHNEDPWLRARDGLTIDQPSDKIIEKDWIINYYSKYVV